jgi:hypothetical protein
MSDDELMEGWFRYPDYWPALHLALNAAAGKLEIHDAIYSEEHDKWFVELTDTGGDFEGGEYYDVGFQLDGSYVRSCYKACKRGNTQWQQKP